MDAPPSVVRRYEGDEGWWEISSRPPAPWLREWVTSYQGYAESAATSLRRRHLPATDVVVIIGFGEPLRFTSTDGTLVHAPRGSFVGGFSDTYVSSEWSGVSSGIQVNFTPSGARLLLGQPLRSLANQVVELQDLLGPAAPRLVERLYEAGGWDARFALLDEVFERHFNRAETSYTAVEHAWGRLLETGGAIDVARLAEEVGWSRRHLAGRFHDEVGLPPKTMARVLRFNRVLDLLGHPGAEGMTLPPWPDLAAVAGYYDQAHLARDFRQFTGYAPGEFVRRRIAGMLDVID